MTNKADRTVFFKNLEVLKERVKNLEHIMRLKEGNPLEESLLVISDIRFNLAMMEGMIVSLKSWTEKEQQDAVPQD